MAVHAWALSMLAVQGSAAEQAGMRQGDEVVAVDGRTVADLNPFEVASLIATAPKPAPPPPLPPAGDSAGASSSAGTFSFATSPARASPGAERGAAVAQGDAGATAAVRVVHEGGEVEEVHVARGKVAQAANPVSAKMALGGRGIIQLRTFNNRAVPAIKVRDRADLQALGCVCRWL